MEKFAVERHDEGEVSILALQGTLDAHTAGEFESALQTLVQEQRYRIVVDLQNLKYISSAGLGIFMGFIETIRNHHGDIKLCCASPRVYKIFDLLGFPRLFEFFEKREQAIHKFQES